MRHDAGLGLGVIVYPPHFTIPAESRCRKAPRKLKKKECCLQCGRWWHDDKLNCQARRPL